MELKSKPKETVIRYKLYREVIKDYGLEAVQSYFSKNLIYVDLKKEDFEKEYKLHDPNYRFILKSLLTTKTYKKLLNKLRYEEQVAINGAVMIEAILKVKEYNYLRNIERKGGSMVKIGNRLIATD